MEKQVYHFGKEAGVVGRARGIFMESFEKVAFWTLPGAEWSTAEEIREYIKTITDEDRKKYCYVLVNALGASEYFGSNINADYFPWDVLCHEGEDYGYKTFLKAHAYAHHANKDPDKSFGIPVLSVLNHRMKRVELIVRLDREKALELGQDGIIKRIDAGEFPDVSMGCFPAGTHITMADGTRRPIELIQVGDEVLTHKGRVRKVTELHHRHYSGPLHSIKAEAHPTLRSTKQHPFYTVPQSQVKEKDDHSNLRWMVERELQPDWVDAESLGLDSYLLEPVPTEELQPTVYESLTEPRHNAFARLLGYYLAEGHLLRNKKKELVGIELTTHKDDPVHDEIEELCTRFGTSNPPSTHEQVNSENSVGIYIFDKELAELCSKHAGSYSEPKKLSREVMFWPKGLQFEMLGAYANGDGCGPSDGSLKFSTASQDLSWQVYLLLLRNGFVPSHYVLNHGATGLSTKPTTEYVVHIGKQQTPHFVRVCAKVNPSEVLKAKNYRVFALENGSKDLFVVTPIREMTAFHVEMEVFNFEVEEDNSYVAEGLAVHNCKVPFDICSICGHHSKTRADYCEHMNPPPEKRGIWGPNKILADGRRICVLNTFPRFFDISFVFIGADKTAKVMAKLAFVGNTICLGDVCTLVYESEKTAGAKIQKPPKHEGARLVKVKKDEWPTDQFASQTSGGNTDSTGIGAEGIGIHKGASAEEGCSDCAVLGKAFGVSKLAADVKLAAHRKVGEIIKSVPTSQFALKKLPALEGDEPDIPKSILESLAGKHSLSDMCTTATMAGMVLKPSEFQRLVLVRMGHKDLADDLDYRGEGFRQVQRFDSSMGLGDAFIPEILRLLADLLQRRTAFGNSFFLRSMMSETPNKVLPTRRSVDDPLLDKISAAYNGYRKSALMKTGQAVEMVRSDPQLRELVLGQGLANVFFKVASQEHLLSRDSMSYLVGAHLRDRRLLSTPTVALETMANNPELHLEF